MYTKEESKERIKELTESFEAKIDFIKTSKEYKEAQIEDEFIKPLFKYLNWNISNEGILNPNEREFIVQAKGRNRKEPDYLLQLENKRRFYIEAKHTKYDLRIRTDYIWQAYSYSYSTQTRPKYEKVDFALLTDFEEFRFFDCTFPVKNHETLNNYCVLDWTFKDYIKNFDKLWEYFERENVRNGSLEQLYISEKKIKENRIPPDKAFLKDLDDEKSGWRIKLAKDVKKYHPEFSAEFITQTVQLILDRFIFIKVLVDREIEEDYIEKIVNKIKSIKDKEEGIIYDECKEIFEQLDKTYNGSIFTKRTELDTVRVSNKILLEVLKDFLPQNSRYNFKVIPIEILGTIYEQFLGKVVVTTAKQAKIDYKAEVRKAGGVYYTPDYIVDYIVEKTVGEKLHNCKKYSDVLEIKICDPACGSGSFLISAYDALIQWTIKYYEGRVKIENGIFQIDRLNKEEKTLVYLDNNGNVRLTSKIKRDILKSCIYGVDIDPQAVEVTKMSLSLKALENTNHYEVYNERTLFHTTILPPLEGNIKCGNSLIGTRNGNIFEFIQGLKREELFSLKPFDWNLEFKTILESGGFDCIIGNPPYFNIDDTWGKKDFRLQVIKEAYSEIYNDKTDILFYFLAKSIQLSKSKISFIISRAFIEAYKADKLRRYIVTNTNIEEIIDFRNFYVFKDVGITTCILTITKDLTSPDIQVYKMLSNNITMENFKEILQDKKQFENFSFKQTSLSENSWSLENSTFLSINQKIDSKGDPIDKILLIGQGMQTGRNEIFGNKTIEQITKFKLKKNQYFKRATNSDIQRYFIKDRGEYLLFLEEFNKFKDLPIGLQEYLKLNSKELKGRAAFKRGNCEWWKFTWPLHEEWYNRKRILCPYLASFNRFMIDENKAFLGLTDTIALFENNQPEDLKYILGLLNSKLLTFRFKTIGKLKSGGIYEYFWNSVSKLVIKRINFENKKEKEIHGKIVSYVESFISLVGENEKEMSAVAKKQLDRQINSIDSQIDTLVYELYELTSDEIKIVEGEQNE